MDGLAATDRIRNIDKNNRYFRDVPVIMLTANALSGQKELFLRNGLNDFLAKPIETQKLNAVLEKWIPPEKQFRLAGTAAKAADAPGNAGATTIPLPEVPGVNSREGLQNTGGSPEVYFRILSVFCRDADKQAVEIREAAAAQDSVRYTILVHALKSACRSIGAADLGALAELLENAGQDRSLGLIADKTGEFLTQLKTITEALGDFLNRHNAETEKNAASAAGLSGLNLTTLKDALTNMDIEAVNVFMKDCMKQPMDSGARELMTEIEHYILLYEYEKAIERIKAVIEP
jgi:CheY-like chemotaxis protein